MVLMLVAALTVTFLPATSVLATQSTIILSDDFETAGDQYQNVETYNSSYDDSDDGGAICRLFNCGGPTYVLVVRNGQSLTIPNISTAGLRNIHLEYYWEEYIAGAGSNGTLEVQWRLSGETEWNELITNTILSSGGNDCTPDNDEDVTLPPEAENTSIDIRFFGNTPNNNIRAHVDNIIVSGDPILTPPGCTEYEYCYTNGSQDALVNGAAWEAQPFTALSNHTVNYVSVQLYKEGTPGPLTVSIRNTDSDLPSGPDLGVGTIYQNEVSATTSPGEWVGTSIGEVQLTAGVRYAIVLREEGAADSNYYGWCGNNLYTSNTSIADACESDDSGATWYTQSRFPYGFSVIHCPEAAVGGEAYPVNKVGLLAPWLALAVIIVAGGVYLVRRRVHSQK
jgi:hypothetical protein